MASLTTEDFLKRLEARGLLPGDLIADLRRHAAANAAEATPLALARWLVRKGHLSKYQAQELLATADAAATPGAASSGEIPGLLDLEEDEEPVAPVRPAEQNKPEPKPSKLLDEELPAAPRQSAPRKAAGAATSPLLDELPEWNEGDAMSGAGPLDGLVDDNLAAAAAAAGTAGPLPLHGSGGTGGWRAAGRLKTGSVWDSKLMLIGGGALLFLTLLVLVLVFAIKGESGDMAFAAAEDEYNKGNFSQAISRYDDYLKRHEGHSANSLARVHRGLARMRQVVGSRDWVRSLEDSKKIIAELRQEETFNEARAELAVLLPRIAEGLAEKAAEAKDAQLVALAHEAVTMSNNPNYVPKKLRNAGLLREVEGKLAIIERELARDLSLQETIAEIQAEIAAGNTEAAYVLRKRLVQTYPDLVNDAQLQEAVKAAARAEQAAIEFQEQAATAQTQERPDAVQATEVLLETSGDPAPGVEGRVVTVVAEGAAYGLDAASGKMLWRRFVGYDTPPPVPVSSAADADWLIVDSVRNELARLEGATGKLRWRRAWPGPLAGTPAVFGERAAVATTAGRLEVVDLADGNSTGFVQLPQRVLAPPAVDRRNGQMYQVGSHSNLYVLSADSKECTSVVYLGHEPGTVPTSPVAFGGYLLVAENAGARHALLRVLQLEDDGASARQVQQIRVEGRVQVPPIADGRRLLVTTDLGGVFVYDVAPPGEKKPLTEVVARPATPGRSVVGYPLTHGAQLWLGAEQLTLYDIQVAAGRLVPKHVLARGDVFLQPLVAIGDVLFHARRKDGQPGVHVAAVGLDDGAAYWETHIAAPPAGAAFVDPQSGIVSAFSSSGALYQLPLSEIGGGPSAPAFSIADALAADSRIHALGGGRMLLASASEPDRVLTVDPQSSRPMHWLRLPAGAAIAPRLFGGRLLVPSAVGPVFCLDPLTGGAVAEPFQPPVANDQRLRWRGPAADAADDALLADSTNIYRVGLRRQPLPHLAALVRAELETPLASPIARLGAVAFAVQADGKLAAFSAADLVRQEIWELGGHVVWGPQAVGEVVLLATDDDQLHCWDENLTKRFSTALARGPLAAAPIAREGQLLLASTSGMVWALDAEGHETGRVETGQPLSGGPVVAGGGLLLTGRDGTLHLVALP